MVTNRVVVAITTYNRKNVVLDHIESFRRMTASPLQIVVSDDGSEDDAVAAIRKTGVYTIFGGNRGVAWNKNRGLLFASKFLSFDTIILCDDDVYPEIFGWDLEWIEACNRFGHVTRQYENFALVAGQGRCNSIGLASQVAGQVLAFRRDVIQSLGYFDIRFGKFGHEHTDLSNRSIRYGHGGIKTKEGGVYYFVIKGGLGLKRLKSTGNYEEANQNAQLLKEFSRDQIYRHAWRNDGEMMQLEKEICEAAETPKRCVPSNFDESAYLAANEDVRRAGLGALKHYFEHGIGERRRMSLDEI